MPNTIKAGPSNQKIPASGTDFIGNIAFAAAGKQMIPKCIHTQVVSFIAVFFKLPSPIQIVLDNSWMNVQGMCHK